MDGWGGGKDWDTKEENRDIKSVGLRVKSELDEIVVVACFCVLAMRLLNIYNVFL